MSFLDINLDDVQEPILPPHGKEVRVMCEDVQDKKAESGTKYYTARLRITDVPDGQPCVEYEPIWHNIFPPQPDDPEDKKKTKARMLKNTMEAFEVPWTSQGVDLNDMKGKEAWIIVEIESDPTYGDRANVKRFLKKR